MILRLRICTCCPASGGSPEKWRPALSSGLDLLASVPDWTDQRMKCKSVFREVIQHDRILYPVTAAFFEKI
ncbi:hypothetical protein AOLI_G00006110 [Acnodon oligacanthus]